jgi:NTP pyrophosphatase (non-canonical NTP hydrolase)
VNLHEYAEQARVTATYAGRGQDVGVAYAALGLVGEATELLQAVISFHNRSDCMSEAGDIAWYIVALADELNIDFTDIEVDAERRAFGGAVAPLTIAAGRIAEHVKKALGKGEFSPTFAKLPIARLNIITTDLREMFERLVDFCEVEGWTFSEVAQANIAKLRARQANGTLLARS